VRSTNTHSIHPDSRAGSPAPFSEGLKPILDKAGFVGLLVIIVATAIPYGTVDAWWEAVFECAVFALTALFAIEVVLGAFRPSKKLFVLLPLLILAVYAFVQAMPFPTWLGGAGNRTLSIDHYQTFITARKMLALFLFLGLLLVRTSTPKRLRWVVAVVVGLGMASAVFGILRQLLQSPDSVDGFGLPFLFYASGYGQFISPNAFAYLMEMTSAILIGLVIGGGARRDRVLIYLTMMVVILTALVLSTSRGSILSFVCQLVVALFVGFNWRSQRRQHGAHQRPTWLASAANSVVARLMVILIIVITLGAGVLWLGGEKLAYKMSNNASAQDRIDATSRSEIWRSTWSLVKHNPLTGVGFGAYFLAIPQYQVGAGRIKVEEAHNDYLDLAASGGLIAIALAVWFVVSLILRMRSSLKSADQFRRAAALGASLGMLGVAVHSLVDFELQITGLAVVFAALIVISIAGREVEHIQKRAKQPAAFNSDDERVSQKQLAS
jgi:putative inorganic carbon (hco3(-)) transporter